MERFIQGGEWFTEGGDMKNIYNNTGCPKSVIPAQAGIYTYLDSCLRRNDNIRSFRLVPSLLLIFILGFFASFVYAVSTQQQWLQTTFDRDVGTYINTTIA